MCGICGIYNTHGGSVDRQIVDGMNEAIRHRGPDGSGTFIKGPVGLGHRRLSIIDVAGGAQPIGNEDDTLQLVFNGEIYNYIELRDQLLKSGHLFKTKSDTEVIIHGYEEWGVDCVSRFNGIFAFALWDGKQQRLFLARDHLGVKPLYYAMVDQRLIFASEIKALLQDPQCPRAVDMKALGALFSYRYVPSPDTLFHGIRKLSPGHILLAGDGTVDVRRYWGRIPEIDTVSSENALMERYQELFEDAMRLQVRSDVPVGLFLSSGVDSGAILTQMRRHISGPLHTFTIGFSKGEKTNETADARELAEQFGALHHEMIVTPEDYLRYFKRYLWDIEEPVGNETAAAFHFVSRLAKNDVKVVLTGQGVDEPWAGYHRHLGVRLSELYSKLPAVVTNAVRNAVNMLPRNERLKRGVASLHEPDMLSRFAKIYTFFDTGMKERLFSDATKEQLRYEGHETGEALRHFYDEISHLDPVSRMLYIDTRTGLPDDLLMVNDKTSMANSLEARVPFLDYRLVEFVETIPVSLKLKGFHGKYLHKRAAEKWLPKKVAYRKKKGFANPIDTWLRGSMSAFVNECLFSEGSAVQKYFDVSYIRRMVTLHEAGREDYLFHLYLLISFELWHRCFIDQPVSRRQP
ncbi:MAG: asparagine synthase (glutamine-hydrolyzing) [Chitinispirillaceae bacterium]|nr:asparagine synthase (glutamine-hydrolyzing) [Chitinispirillaceae bacterium]